jgi:hypothetical protein
LTTGAAIWTEPTAHSEIWFGATRMRLEGGSQLDMLAVDDTRTRLQLDQGRLDVRRFALETNDPYEIVTPRGTVQLTQQGDYYVEAGSMQDPTRLGVRTGLAQVQTPNGEILEVQPGQVAELLGDPYSPQLRVVSSAPPTPPVYWAIRDRQVVYQPPQYLSVAVTGYEDLAPYGSWIHDGTYGKVWLPRAVPAGWAPYRTGHWVHQRPWGWTWVDDQPWGFAPYHYGRWANIGGRWVWVPPQRDVRPVYAPALVAFVGGVELTAALSTGSVAPVGWFPLGPREIYVPAYKVSYDYYSRLNLSARAQDEILRERWERIQRHEAFEAGERAALMNQRFATVVPAVAFVHSEPVMRAALRAAPEKLATVPVARVAAPPAATVPMTAAAQGRTPAAAAKAENMPGARTAIAGMPTLEKPAAAERAAARPAPGPKLAATEPAHSSERPAKPPLPPLAPRAGAEPPVVKGPVVAVQVQHVNPGPPARQVVPESRETRPADKPGSEPEKSETKEKR